MSGSTYVCALSKGKRVWVKQRTSRPAPPVNVIPATVPPTDLSLDSRITTTEGLLDLGHCRAPDMTPRPGDGQGFPRPANAMPPTGTVRILVLPFSTRDYEFSATDLGRLKSALAETRDFYRRVSDGRIELAFDYADSPQWVRLPGTADDYNLINKRPQQNNMVMVEEIFRLASASIDFDAYDSVILESTRWSSSGGGQGFSGERFPAPTGTAKRVNLHFGNAVQNVDTIRHELGHTLFGLEDLYVFLNDRRPSVPNPTPFYNWDIMSGSGPIEADFSGWNKFLIGWLNGDNVVCRSGEVAETTHHLVPPGSMAKPRLLLVPVEPGVTLAIEARMANAYTTVPGALVYLVDSRIQHGDGPISSLRAPLNTGETATMSGYSIRLLDANATGILVHVGTVKG